MFFFNRSNANLMHTQPAPLPALPNGITALLGGMLGALLYALLGRWEWACREPAEWEGTWRAEGVAGALHRARAAQDAIALEAEPIVEWECVPAPWRAGQLLPIRHARALGLPLPCRRAPPILRLRGPPYRAVTLANEKPARPEGHARALAHAHFGASMVDKRQFHPRIGVGASLGDGEA